MIGECMETCGSSAHLWSVDFETLNGECARIQLKFNSNVVLKMPQSLMRFIRGARFEP